MTLENVKLLNVTGGHVAWTEQALRESGAEGFERFVLWSGVRTSVETFDVRCVHSPEQTSSRHDGGLLVRIEGVALYRLNTWLFENQQILVAQIHAHPTDAFHSDTDDDFPIVTTLGGLSIVAADFCREPLFSQGTAVFRLSRRGWEAEPGVEFRIT